MSKPARSEILLAGLVTGLLLLPFITKAYNVDDTLFLRVARQIAEHPFHPYDFDYNWYGSSESMWRITQNPPLNSYLLAALTLGGHQSEVCLHIAYLVLASCCAALGFRIARRVCRHPRLAVALAFGGPAFLVSATNVMADVPLIFFWLLAIDWTMVAAEQDRPSRLWLAGLAASAAVMTKYFGIALAPLLAAYWWHRRGRRFSIHMAAFALPAVALLAWGAYAAHETGSLHFFKAAEYASRSVDRRNLPDTVVFFGGTLGWPLLALPLSSRFRWWIPVGALALFGAWAPFALVEEPIAVRALWVLMGASGAVALATNLLSMRNRFDSSSLLLGLWCAGTLIFCVGFNWTVGARVILPAALPATLLVVRYLESRPRSSGWIRAGWGVAGLTIALSLLLAVADQDYAGAGRVFARRVSRIAEETHSRIWYIGHWGYQHYLEEIGADSFDYARSAEAQLAAGELIAVHFSGPGTYRLHGPMEPVLDLTLPSRLPLHTNNFHCDAGFYSNRLGRVPFTMGSGCFLDRLIVLKFVPE